MFVLFGWDQLGWNEVAVRVPPFPFTWVYPGTWQESPFLPLDAFVKSGVLSFPCSPDRSLCF